MFQCHGRLQESSIRFVVAALRHDSSQNLEQDSDGLLCESRKRELQWQTFLFQRTVSKTSQTEVCTCEKMRLKMPFPHFQKNTPKTIHNASVAAGMDAQRWFQRCYCTPIYSQTMGNIVIMYADTDAWCDWAFTSLTSKQCWHRPRNGALTHPGIRRRRRRRCWALCVPE